MENKSFSSCGCAIGIRPINFYLSMLEKMGALIIKDGYVKASVRNNLKPINYKLNFPSVGVTHFFNDVIFS